MDDFDLEGFVPDNIYTGMDDFNFEGFVPDKFSPKTPNPRLQQKVCTKASQLPVKNKCTLCPIGRRDSSHNMAQEASGCSAVMDVDMNDTSMPDTIVQENHSGALSMSSSVVPDILLPDTICTQTNPKDASDIFCNASNTFLKLWRGCTSGAEISSRHILHGDPLLLREKDSMVHKSVGRVVRQFPIENSCLASWQDGSLSTTTPMVPVIDFYAPLPGFLCSEQSQHGNMIFKRESSSDSSFSILK